MLRYELLCMCCANTYKSGDAEVQNLDAHINIYFPWRVARWHKDLNKESGE